MLIKKPRSQPPPVLEKFKSTDRHSQECVIEAGEVEGTAPSGEGGVVVQVEGFQI